MLFFVSYMCDGCGSLTPAALQQELMSSDVSDNQ